MLLCGLFVIWSCHNSWSCHKDFLPYETESAQVGTAALCVHLALVQTQAHISCRRAPTLVLDQMATVAAAWSLPSDTGRWTGWFFGLTQQGFSYCQKPIKSAPRPLSEGRRLTWTRNKTKSSYFLVSCECIGASRWEG